MTLSHIEVIRLTRPPHHRHSECPSLDFAQDDEGRALRVPLEEGWCLPGQAIPRDGYLAPSDAPGFGLEIPHDWFTPFFA